MIGQARGCAESASATIFLGPGGIAWTLYNAIALIIVVWTGLQIMFSGQFGIGEVVNLVFLLGVPYAILTYYSTPAPTGLWGSFTFTDMITRGGTELAQDMLSGAWSDFTREVVGMFEYLWNKLLMESSLTEVAGITNQTEGASGGSNWFMDIITLPGRAIDAIFGVVFNAVSFIFHLILSIVVMILMVLVIIIPAIVAYCSYLWGHVSMIAAVFIGPLFVPFMMVPQLSFLFWGWFKMLLGAAVHTMVAAATFVTVAQILLMPVRRFVALAGDMGVTSQSGILDPVIFIAAFFGWLIESMPLIVIAFLGAFKIGELTSMIMNSGPMPSAGLGDRIRGAQSLQKGAGAAGRMMGGLGGGAGAARGAASAAGMAAGVATAGVATAAIAGAQVVSQATKFK